MVTFLFKLKAEIKVDVSVLFSPLNKRMPKNMSQILHGDEYIWKFLNVQFLQMDAGWR